MMTRVAAVFIVLLLALPAAAQVVPVPTAFTNYSMIVPATATDIWPATTGHIRVRAIAIDTAVSGGTAYAATVWCAWGTVEAGASQNVAAVGGALSFPLYPGFDDAGWGVNQGALNCVQAGGTHAVRLETYQ